MKFITQNKERLIAQAIAIALFGFILFVFSVVTQNGPNQALAEINSSGCTASSSVITIGHQASTMIAPPNSNRASLHVEQPDIATNTVYSRLSSSAATTANGTLILEKVSSTSTRSWYELGKNTSLPYTGAVTAITDTGSSSVRVTECIY
jgi:hypothetical protein